MADIYTLSPRNKTAALVVSQAGCTSHAGLSDDQIRANLVARWKYLHQQITNLPKNSDLRKVYGREQIKIQAQISDLRQKMHFGRGLSEYICDIVKKRMTKFQWETLVKQAEENRKKEMIKHAG